MEAERGFGNRSKEFMGYGGIILTWRKLWRWAWCRLVVWLKTGWVSVGHGSEMLKERVSMSPGLVWDVDG